MEREFIKTSFSHTISMSLEDGEKFASSDSYLEVVNSKNHRSLGFITSEYFLKNRYHRHTSSGSLIWVCSFFRD